MSSKVYDQRETDLYSSIRDDASLSDVWWEFLTGFRRSGRELRPETPRDLNKERHTTATMPLRYTYAFLYSQCGLGSHEYTTFGAMFTHGLYYTVT